MRPDLASLHSQITFLYYEQLDVAARFYGQVMGLKLVEDQTWAKIYQVSERAFVGLVDGARGFHQPQAKNAVMLTLVVDDVAAWFEYLKAHDVPVIKPPATSNELQIEYCFVEDPGGYVIEIEKFLKPELATIFYG